jgi:hypothetical protein
MQNKPENKLHLSSEREKLLEVLLRNKGINLPSHESIARNSGPLQLSFRQEGLLLRSAPPAHESSFQNIIALIGLDGELSVHAVVAALNEIVRRHEILRTSFPLIEGRPTPVLNPHLALQLSIIDLIHLLNDQRASAIKEIVSQQWAEPFYPLREGPLIRSLLLAVEKKVHLLVLTMHHSICDGLSVGIFMKEFAEIYAAYGRGDPSPLQELEIQYSDYAAWQRQRTVGEVLDRDVRYWRENLSGALDELIASPVERPARRPIQSGEELEIGGELLNGIREVMRLEALTMFMVLLAAFTALLGLDGAQRVLVGSPIDFRLGSGSENLIGLFVNVAALRVDLSGLSTFKQLFRRVKEVALGAFNHQDVPFDRLVTELASHPLHGTPLFPAMFAMQNRLPSEFSAGNVNVTVQKLEERAAEFDLMLVIEERQNGLRGRVEYNTDVYDPERIKRMTGHFKSILRTIVHDRDGSLSELRLLND